MLGQINPGHAYPQQAGDLGCCNPVWLPGNPQGIWRQNNALPLVNYRFPASQRPIETQLGSQKDRAYGPLFF